MPKPTPAPVEPVHVAPKPTPVAPVAEVGPSSPKEACGARVFLAMAFCMQDQCQTPKFTNHPQCVEMRQDQKDSQERMKNRH
jgi:hypothetical protein